MIILNFGKWMNGANKHFTYKRIYIQGYRWTPFVIIKLRKYNESGGAPVETTP